MMTVLYTIAPVHISLIRAGDVVEYQGDLRTVSAPDLKHDHFLGTTLFGNSYRLGTVPVLKADIFREQSA